MSSQAGLGAASDPLQVLGLPRHASEQDVRRRYLELVREFPPERDAARFQQIHAAYKAAEDPLVLAKRLLDANEAPPPTWSEVLEPQRANPPRLTVDVLLGLGNRPASSDSTASETHDE